MTLAASALNHPNILTVYDVAALCPVSASLCRPRESGDRGLTPAMFTFGQRPAQADRILEDEHAAQIALPPRSPVRMRTQSSSGEMKILPSPTCPVRAPRMMASIAFST